MQLHCVRVCEHMHMRCTKQHLNISCYCAPALNSTVINPMSINTQLLLMTTKCNLQIQRH